MISILLATYNGERFLKEQLESILAQSVTDWTLFVRDDCSTDATPAILQDYAGRYPGKIHVTTADKPSGGAKWNFFQLCRTVRDDYVMLCDQDDVWLPDKIECTLAAMKQLEQDAGAHTPLLVHTDLKVVDGQLNTINESLWAFQRISPERDELRNVVVQNNVTGCTAMYNRALAELIDGVPEVFVMHDWWIALLASALGRTGFVSRPTMLYRQHGANSVGAKDAKSAGFLIAKFKNRATVRHNYYESFSQADCFLNQYRVRLTKGQQALLADYAALLKAGKMKKIRILIKNRFYKNTLSRTLGQFVSI